MVGPTAPLEKPREAPSATMVPTTEATQASLPFLPAPSTTTRLSAARGGNSGPGNADSSVDESYGGAPFSTMSAWHL